MHEKYQGCCTIASVELKNLRTSRIVYRCLLKCIDPPDLQAAAGTVFPMQFDWRML